MLPFRSAIYLEFEINKSKKVVYPSDLISCSAIFKVTNVQEPQSIVYCMQKHYDRPEYVTGLDLYSGRMYTHLF